MANTGQTLETPASGERITFRQTAANTGGALLAIDLELPPGRRVPGGLVLRRVWCVTHEVPFWSCMQHVQSFAVMKDDL